MSSHDHGDESMNVETDDAMTASPARAPPRHDLHQSWIPRFVKEPVLRWKLLISGL